MAADANWFQHRGRWPLTTRWPLETQLPETPAAMAVATSTAASSATLDSQRGCHHEGEPASEALLTTIEAARIVRLSPRTLERLRVTGQGPRFTKAGPGKRARVLYRRVDIDQWLEQFSFVSTAQYGNNKSDGY